jgi:hypothetical protein
MNDNAPNTQVLLFQHLKTLIAPHLSMVDEVAELLDISPDSAYRRIRGEKPISLEEIRTICFRYNVSLDQFLHIKTDSILFAGNVSGKKDNIFEEWLDNLLQQLGFMTKFPNKHMYWLLKDIPPISHFHIPELALFKFYLWTKSILQYDSMKGVKFDFSDKRYDKYLEKSKMILDGFSKIPITEIWNIESINSSLRQIRFHYEAGSFKSSSEVILLLNKLTELIDHFELQAEAGVKFKVGGSPSSSNVPYKMFVNELILGDNTTFFEAGDLKITFLNHSVLHFVYTRDERFNRMIFENFDNLMKKSTMISSVSEKERATFFNALRHQISQAVADIK